MSMHFAYKLEFKTKKVCTIAWCLSFCN